MDHFAGLDVSVKQTSICIVDDTGRIVKEVKVASEPAALLKVLGNPAYLPQAVIPAPHQRPYDYRVAG
jgi:transposase